MNILFRVTLFIACISAINLASSIGTPANADVVTDWNNAALDAIRADRTAPPIASRSLAILHASIYDAVNGIARTYEPYLVQSAVQASASREAAASAKLRQVLRRTKCSSTYFQLVHPPSMHFTQQSSLQSLMEHTRPMASCGVNLLRTKFSPREPTMVGMLSSSHLAAAVRACGCPLRRRSFRICCHNGDLWCLLE